MKILINQSSGPLKRSDGVTEDHIKKIKDISPDIEVVLAEEGSTQFINELIDTDALISSRLLQIDLQSAPKLRWIHVTSAGVNNLPENIRTSEIIITNSSGVHPIPISEHVFGLMLMLSRGIDIAFKNQILKKRWIRDASLFRGVELFGKNLLVVGMGRIGERVAVLGKAFGMDTKGVVRNPEKHSGDIPVYSMDDLDQLLQEADFVVNALPSTEETRGLFNQKKFDSFKTGSFFINIGRGDTVVEKDLIKNIENKKLAGVGLDVTEVEPLPESSSLWDLDNVIITPHISGLNPNYTDRMIDIFCENLATFIKGDQMPNLVDKKLGY